MAWKTEPTENVRAKAPKHYWFHKYDGRRHFMWDDIEVSEQEFRRHVDAGSLARVDAALEAMKAGQTVHLEPPKASLGGGTEF
jgi:hypothetical protein